jgi:hypothetical protein
MHADTPEHPLNNPLMHPLSHRSAYVELKSERVYGPGAGSAQDGANGSQDMFAQLSHSLQAGVYTRPLFGSTYALSVGKGVQVGGV